MALRSNVDLKGTFTFLRRKIGSFYFPDFTGITSRGLLEENLKPLEQKLVQLDCTL